MEFVKLRREKRVKRKFELWLISFSCIFLLSTINNAVEVYKYAFYLNNVRKELVRSDSEDITNQSKKMYAAKDYGDFAKIMPILKHNLETSERMRSKLNATCDNLQNILTPKCLCEYQNIIQSKDLLYSALNILNQWENFFFEAFNANKSKIHEILLKTSGFRWELLRGFENGIRHSRKLIAEYFQAERESANTISDLLDFLCEKLGTFWEFNETLVFILEEDQILFENFSQELIALEEQKNLILQQLNNCKIIDEMM